MVVDKLGDLFLADAALPGDEDRRVGRCDTARQINGAAERRRHANEGHLLAGAPLAAATRLLLARFPRYHHRMRGAP